MKMKSKKVFYKRPWFIVLAVIFALGSWGSLFDDNFNNTDSAVAVESTAADVSVDKNSTEGALGSNTDSVVETQAPTEVNASNTEVKDNQKASTKIESTSIELEGKTYKVVDVAGGDISGSRQPNAAVNIGFGDRGYWGFTNEYGQLIRVTAAVIILQDPNTEAVLSTGRYYEDEAKVPGTEREDLDEGHVIADSLGGVSNAYNITPQDSTLNRHGDQAYMEKVIRDAGGCTNFVATITYPSTDTQIPSKYSYSYEIQGRTIVDAFENVNPDKVNEALPVATEAAQITPPITVTETPAASFDEQAELIKVDANGNGKVTIAEAKGAGFKMPISSDHWLYKYMDDRDGDGQVGE